MQLNRLHGVTSQKMILFITTAVKTSNPTKICLLYTTIFMKSVVPMDGSYMFLQNTGKLLLDFMSSHPRR
jgi:hypothetical protein